MTEAFKQGMIAFENGELYNSNPFSFWYEHKKYIAWNKGYMSCVRKKGDGQWWSIF